MLWTVLIILVILALLGGGYGYRSGYYWGGPAYNPGYSYGSIVLVIIVIILLFSFAGRY